jgi:hypothetical protein
MNFCQNWEKSLIVEDSNQLNESWTSFKTLLIITLKYYEKLWVFIWSKEEINDEMQMRIG